MKPAPTATSRNPYDDCGFPYPSYKKIKTMTEEQKKIVDEMGQFPLTFKMNGCKFRSDMLKMAFEVGRPHKSVDSLIIKTEKLINWVNNETDFNQILKPQSPENQPPKQ